MTDETCNICKLSERNCNCSMAQAIKTVTEISQRHWKKIMSQYGMSIEPQVDFHKYDKEEK